MADVKIIFGSSTGNSENTANILADKLGGTAINITDATADDFNADLLILGGSSTGCGDLNDDWEANIDKMDSVDLTGKTVAIFGQGDQASFCDSFCGGPAKIAKKAQERGANLIGKTSSEGYEHTESEAEEDGMFCGLMLDEQNQPELSDDRINAWVEELKKAL